MRKILEAIVLWLVDRLGLCKHVDVRINLVKGMNVACYTRRPLIALTAFRPLIDAGVLEVVRYQHPETGEIQELFHTTYPKERWANHIGVLQTGHTYYIKVKEPFKGFKF